MKIVKYFYMIFLVGLVIFVAYTKLTVKEINNLQVWNRAYNNLGSANSYTVKEETELRYTINNNEYSNASATIRNLKFIPSILEKNIHYDVENGSIDVVPVTNYYLQEDSQYFYISKVNEKLVKNQISSSYLNKRNREITPYYFLLNHIPLSMQKPEQKIQEYTFSFKLSQYNEEYHYVFDDIINKYKQYFNVTTDINIIDTELVQTIKFDPKTGNFELISVDLTPILKEIINLSNYSQSSNYRLVTKYTFSNYDTVKIDETEYKDAILDDAPNTIEEKFAYSTYQINREINGQFDYGKDVDVYKLYVISEDQYIFKMNTLVNYNIYLIDQEQNRIDFVNSSYEIMLQPGSYHLIVESKDNVPASYTINTVIKGDAVVIN